MEYLSPRRALITGGAGFLGYHLAHHLLREGAVDALVLVDNLRRGRRDAEFEELLLDPRVAFLELDLVDPDAYKKLGNGYGHVYHLAAINGTKFFYEIPHEVLRVNMLSLIYMLDWFRRENRGGKFCFTSSGEAYAGGFALNLLPVPTPEKVPLVVEDPYNPRWSYGSTKLLGELFMVHYANAYDLRALVVRPHNLYGPRAGYNGHVIPDFLTRIMKRTDPFPIHGAGEERAFCYVSDAVNALALLMASPATDALPIETVHVGDPFEITIRELAEKLFTVAMWRPKEFDTRPAPAGGVRRRCADITKLQRLVNWKPAVPLEEGLKKTYEWYAAHQEG